MGLDTVDDWMQTGREVDPEGRPPEGRRILLLYAGRDMAAAGKEAD